MNRALRMCLKSGCGTLVQQGYCDKHRHIQIQKQRLSWEELSKHKTEESKKFYSSSRWTQCSVVHRSREPLCRRCKAEGKIAVAEIVHHNPAREILIERGLNPYDDRWLESLCFDHHQQELRKRRVAA